MATRCLAAGERELARELFGLMAEVFGEAHQPLSDAYLDRLLAREDFWAIAAFVEDRLVGGLTAHTLPLTRAELAEVFIYDLAVRPEYQRRGVGRQLVAALRTEASARGVETVFVAADDEDAGALEFYRRLGGAASPVTLFTFDRPDA